MVVLAQDRLSVGGGASEGLDVLHGDLDKICIVLYGDNTHNNL